MPAEASRYKTILKLASGGNATVWIGAVQGAFGFRQLVAIKKPHSHILEQPGFRAELMAEARLASLIQHGNVVDVRDVSLEGDQVSLVMDYIEGASLQDLMIAAVKKGQRLSPRVIVRIVLDACAGLHAAHELKDERNRPIGLVHRDVSPHNILVGTDGIARVADFGVAKFTRKYLEATDAGIVKGKLAYMAPEYVKGESIDRRFDIFALGAVIWEGLCWSRCFRGANDAETLNRILTWSPPPISEIVPELGNELDAVVATALAKSPDERFATIAALANALEVSATAAGLLGAHADVAKAVAEIVGAAIEERRAIIRANLADEPSLASMMMPAPEIVAPPMNLLRVPVPTDLGPRSELPILNTPLGHETTVIITDPASDGPTIAEPVPPVSLAHDTEAEGHPPVASVVAPTPRRSRRQEPTVKVRPGSSIFGSQPVWFGVLLIALAVAAVVGAILAVVVVARKGQTPSEAQASESETVQPPSPPTASSPPPRPPAPEPSAAPAPPPEPIEPVEPVELPSEPEPAKTHAAKGPKPPTPAPTVTSVPSRRKPPDNPYK